MDAAVQQFLVDKQCLKIVKKELVLENDRLLQQIMSQEVLLTVMNSMSLIGESLNMDGKRKESSSIQLNQENFQKDDSCNNQNALEIPEFFKNNDLKAQLQDKDTTIYKLKDMIKSMREKSKEENVKYDYGEIETKNVELENRKEIVDIAAQIPSATTIVLGMFKLDLEPLAPSAKKVPFTPKNNVKKVRFAEPLISSSNIKHVESSNTSDSKTPVLSSTGLKCSTSKCGSKPTSNKRNNKILQTPSRNIVKHLKLNANSDLNCATCKKSLFDDVRDKCLLDFVKNVNSCAKSAKKHKKQNIWKPTGHVFTKVGFKWKPTGRTFTIVGNLCPLTRITSTNIVPPKKTTSDSVKTQKPELKVYSRKPKNVGSSKKAKIIESKNANHSEPNHIWGSNATNIPSSSSLVMTGCPDCSLVSGLRMFETHDRESLSAHELC
ncbi:hypothetical protein Tco_1453285 [Tanacetum coccineum]